MLYETIQSGSNSLNKYVRISSIMYVRMLHEILQLDVQQCPIAEMVS